MCVNKLKMGSGLIILGVGGGLNNSGEEKLSQWTELRAVHLLLIFGGGRNGLKREYIHAGG